MASLWGGRFEKDMDEIVKKYNASIFFDQRMYNEDIDGSIAHVTMLGKQGIVSNEEKDQIIAGLEEIRKEIVEGKILFTVEDEDIHMGIESRLIDKIGDVGKKLHTSRSRNDQCQVDIRLYLRKEIYEILNSLCYLESVILEKAEKYEDKIKAAAASMDNYGNFYGQNLFLASSGVLLISNTLSDLGYATTGLEIAKASVPVAVIAFILVIIQNIILDKQLERTFGKRNK